MESRSDDHVLTEGCIANVLSLTTPIDACRMSAVAPIFRAAAEADAVWERFLPSDYSQIISRSINNNPSFLLQSSSYKIEFYKYLCDNPIAIENFRSKKDLYMYLCDTPILIDGGSKSFWLEKRSGKKCYMLAARQLYIAWSDTPLYWQWAPFPVSRFEEVAQLQDVCWLELTCNLDIDVLSPGTEYAAYFVYNTNQSFYGLDGQSVEVFANIGGQERKKNSVSLVPLDKGTPTQGLDAFDDIQNYPKQRNDGWLEVELGEFLVLTGEEGYLIMGLLGLESKYWKSGIIVEGFEIRPKNTAIVTIYDGGIFPADYEIPPSPTSFCHCL